MQRQRLPARALAISSRLGSVFLERRDSACITIPGEQNPHWDAPEAMKQSAHSRRSSEGSPSWVVMVFPAARLAGWAHETTAFPSTRTVHAPHEPSGAQPSLTEVTPQPSRRSSSMVAPSRTSIDTAVPLSVKSIGDPPSRYNKEMMPESRRKAQDREDSWCPEPPSLPCAAGGSRRPVPAEAGCTASPG